jgi:thymidylate synthase (FAD)
MNVEIINPDEVKDIFNHWSKFAATCYSSTINPDKPDVIGKHCLKSGHFSGSRSQYIEFQITDCPRFVIDQLVRSEQGVCKNVQSFRYVEKDGFNYAVPKEILDNKPLMEQYVATMRTIQNTYNQIDEYVQNKSGLKERASEQARYVLPMATCSAVTIGCDVEALIHLCHMRLCVRAEDTIRELVNKMRYLTLQLLPELTEYLVPQCEYLLWCPETKSCGAYPTKNELKEKINK